MTDLRAQLDALAHHVRDPDRAPGPPGIEARRLKVYRDLVYNNLDALLAGTFPVIRATLGDAAWAALVRAFLVHHRARTPLFTELGQELVAFLASAQGADGARPWLAELAHYEWAELGLQLSDAALPPHDAAGDLLDRVPVLSPLAWPLAYRWPVSRIGPDHQPAELPREPTLLLLRREDDGGIHFSSLSPLAFRLLGMIAANDGGTGRTLLQGLAGEAGQADLDAFVDDARPLLQRLHAERVLLGTRID